MIVFTLTFRLPGLINFIAIGRGVGVLKSLGDLRTWPGIAKLLYKLSRLLVSILLFNFFLPIFLSLAVAKVSGVDSILETWPQTWWSRVPIERSKRISLKVPILLVILFLNANLLISRDWCLDQAFSTFSANFFSTVAAFFNRVFVSRVALPLVTSYWF